MLVRVHASPKRGVRPPSNSLCHQEQKLSLAQACPSNTAAIPFCGPTSQAKCPGQLYACCPGNRSLGEEYRDDRLT